MVRQVDIVKVFDEDNYIGRMALSPENLAVFEYDTECLKSGFSISPFYLPLRPGLFTARSEPFNGLFGVFNDSLPDGWGNLLIDRYLVSKGINPQTLSPLDRLGIVGSSGMGALRYVPDNHIKATQALTKNIEDAFKLFRLMVFNVLTGNKDDHAKNFSFIFRAGRWRLSPAYDLVPGAGFNNNHSTTIAGKGNPGMDDIFEVTKKPG